jgi:hypothetical protein
MQTLIYKTELSVEHAPAWLSLTAPVQLCLEADGSVSASADRPATLFGFRRSGPVRIGVLTGQARDLLVPALETNAPLRVRIVELVPPHIAAGGRAQVAVSVWGDPDQLRRPTPTQSTPDADGG